MAARSDAKRGATQLKADLSMERTKTLRREFVVGELEKAARRLSDQAGATKDENRLADVLRAAAAMLRDDAMPRPKRRVTKTQFEHYAVYIWHQLKRFARKNGRERWSPAQRQLAAKESIRIAESVYRTQKGKMRPGELFKLLDQPLNKKVQRKGDVTPRVELRNADLIAHFESLGTLKGFGFDFNVPAATRKALIA